MLSNLPNALTVGRIALIPVVMLLIYMPGETARWAAAGLFVLAAVTDYLDGWLARRLDVVSEVGRALDPIADKLLVAAVLLMLAGVGRLSDLALIPAVVILSREILVSGLREALAGRTITMPVTNLAKWKTATQLAALPLLLVGDAGFIIGLSLQGPGEFLLWIAGGLTARTGYTYVMQALAHMREAPS